MENTLQHNEVLRSLAELRSQVHSRQHSGVVVLPSNRSGNVVVMCLGTVTVVGLLYLRLVRGIPFTEMFGSSSHALKQLRLNMKLRMDDLNDRLTKHWASLTDKQDVLSGKQDSMAEAISESARQQADISRNVDGLQTGMENLNEVASSMAGDILGVRSDFSSMQGDILQIGDRIEQTGHGMALVCRAMGEAMHAMGFGTTQTLSSLRAYVGGSALPDLDKESDAPKWDRMSLEAGDQPDDALRQFAASRPRSRFMEEPPRQGLAAAPAVIRTEPAYQDPSWFQGFLNRSGPDRGRMT